MSNLNSVIPTGSLRATTTRRSVLIAVSLLLPVFAFFLLEPPQVAEVQSSESECFDLVQGRIAWNYEGNRSWSPNNIQNLCRGTSNPRQPGRCFYRAMHGNINWGGGTRWQWENALQLCAGTNDADETISCFQEKVRSGLGWSDAIRACNERRCFNLVQGQIAWNYEGSRTWVANNVQNLCRGASNPTQPPRCFARAMHGGINWGGSTRWQWENALSLCTGSKNAGTTISCFQEKITNGVSWQEAIQSCKGDRS
ncbi:MAG TPA: hypothetical protein VIF64_14620 [Pyrinomonadaceae bacterium]